MAPSIAHTAPDRTRVEPLKYRDGLRRMFGADLYWSVTWPADCPAGSIGKMRERRTDCFAGGDPGAIGGLTGLRFGCERCLGRLSRLRDLLAIMGRPSARAVAAALSS
jgi:hypothetical protein